MMPRPWPPIRSRCRPTFLPHPCSGSGQCALLAADCIHPERFFVSLRRVTGIPVEHQIRDVTSARTLAASAAVAVLQAGSFRE